LVEFDFALGEASGIGEFGLREEAFFFDQGVDVGEYGLVLGFACHGGSFVSVARF
jgi:hypothetical protein